MKKIFLPGFILMLILIGCNHSDHSDWYESKEKAIESGLKQEGTDVSAILSIEEYEGETLVFYEHSSALGVASVSENDKGFKWFRSNPYIDFDVKGDLSYTTGSFDFETETGLDVSVLHGKVFDNSIKKMRLSEDGQERELVVFEDSNLFYAIHQKPFTSLEVAPHRNEW